MKTKSISSSRYIAFFAIILALSTVALALPAVFLLPLLFVAVSFGFGVTMITALCFGLISYLLSFAGSGSFVPLAFIEQPIIPIVPRLLVGLTTYFTNFSISKIIVNNKKLKEYLPKLIAAAVGTLTNTVFVILFMYIFLPSGFSYGEETLVAFTPFMILSGCIELVAGMLVLPPLAIAVNKNLRRTGFGEMLKGV